MELKISVVVTLYYSEKYVREFYSRITKALLALTENYEIIFVNDGSPDGANLIVLELQHNDPNIILIDLSRNFGHHQAILAGLSQASGEYIFLIDIDLEEDPELLVYFWNIMKADQHTDVVFGIQQKRKGNFFEKVSGNLFYKILNSITHFNYPANTLTARLMKIKYVESVLRFKEKAMDIWAIFVLAGFKQVGVPAEKTHKGSTTYTFYKKLAMSIEIITSFSHRPLYSIFAIGLVWSILSIINVFIILIKKWVYGIPVEGWASIMASVWLIGGIIVFLIGIISIYLSKIFLEIKDRPSSIVKNVYRKK